jgi:dipeptidyl aminopeptidase/acylaminoacyl peptidase
MTADAVPAKHEGKVPLIVFVHGNGGNFEFYPWLLARAATERGFAIAFPSNGLGIWHGPDTAARVGRVVDAVSTEAPIDETRVFLVGISAGGLAVFGAAQGEPRRYRGVVAVSAVFPDFVKPAVLRGTSVLILHGTDDPRAPVEQARRACEQLRRAGVPVDLEEEKGRGHLALLTDRERWVPLLLDWLSRH